MNEWKPIETAPKDGTYILVCQKDIPGWDGNMWVVAFFGVGEEEPIPSWWTSGGPNGGIDFIGDPFSHWQPLPPPPTE